jgi:gluconolactonase
MQYPNGVCLSPDEHSLFLCSNKQFEATVLEFDASTLRFRRVVCEANSDGIKCDKAGNLYLCTKDGILILDQEGKKLGLIELPTIPANICWGGKDRNDLFITARQNIFLVRDLQKNI